jgi:hypothetical protein
MPNLSPERSGIVDHEYLLFSLFFIALCLFLIAYDAMVITSGKLIEHL